MRAVPKAGLQLCIAGFSAFSAIFISEAETSYGYAKPFFVTYSGSLETVLLLLIVLRCIAKPHTTETTEEHLHLQGNKQTPHYSTFPQPAEKHPQPQSHLQLPQNFTILSKTALFYAFCFTLLTFGVNITFFLALSLTNLPSAQTLEQLSSIFTFVLSLVILREGWDWRKPFAMMVALGGAVLVIWADTSATLKPGPHPLVGDSLAVCSALLGALYIVGYCHLFGGFDCTMVLKFAVLKETLAVVLLWPVFFLWNTTKVEIFQWPSIVELVFVVLGNGCALGFNIALAWGTLVLSPLSANLSVLLGLPITFLWDVARTGQWNWLRFGGLFVVAAGVASHDAISAHPQKKTGAEPTGCKNESKA
eukprot:TRINITY_DN35116_c0_g1_i1.p1 TRINITY_DN35116_c0_g1~~TRINITY_DN35116_c0_g1_i1.p1  ORF type:complete len:363 (+),score=45.63 TRINITY_DN35116_c0_g1_i1:87-1175(+)